MPQAGSTIKQGVPVVLNSLSSVDEGVDLADFIQHFIIFAEMFLHIRFSLIILI